MGWAKFRDRVRHNIGRETKNFHSNVKDEIKRVRTRLAVSPDRASIVISATTPIENASTSQEFSPKNDESLNVPDNCEVNASAHHAPPSTPAQYNPLNLKPGLAFLINHFTFDDPQFYERIGSEFDIEKFEQVFQQFQIVYRTVRDGTLLDVKRIMDEVEMLDFSEYASIVLVIMSYGYENNMIAAKDGVYSLDKHILYPILRNKSLVGKHKFLFVECSKGDTDLRFSTVTPDEILQFHSCGEGYCSFIHTHGSIFIQTLCEILEEYGDKDDIRHICNKVIDSVCIEFGENQIPMMHTNIRIPLYVPSNCEGDASAIQPTSTPLQTSSLTLKPGLAFLINHSTFDNSELDDRKGSEFDIAKVEQLFQQFKIIYKTVPDGTLMDVKLIMEEVKNLDFSEYAILVIIIMSHGYENNMIAAKDGKYSLDKDILYPILRNESLVGKHKLLFVQSCKGVTNLTRSIDSKNISGIPTKTPDEILQFHSCGEGICDGIEFLALLKSNLLIHTNIGYTSLRLVEHGSIFSQTLCEILEKCGETEDIRDICNKVIDTVCKEFEEMQIPMLHTNIRKPFVFGHYKS